MARPTKSAKLLTECSQTKDEISERIRREAELKGAADKIKPPSYMSAPQKKIFRNIVLSLEESNILGNLDVYLLEQTSICIDRLQFIEKSINKDNNLLLDTDFIRARNAYASDFKRYCNELSLSPQSRAKLANVNMQSEKEKQDPLLKVLAGGKLA